MVEKKAACSASSYASTLVPLSWNTALVFNIPELIYGIIYTNGTFQKLKHHKESITCFTLVGVPYQRSRRECYPV